MTLSPRASAALVLFEDASKNSMELFERALGLTVVCHSYFELSNFMHIVLGCKQVTHFIPTIKTSKLTARIAWSLDEMMIPKSGIVANEYMHVPKPFPGFDGRVAVMTEVGRDSAMTVQYFYMQACIAPDKLVSESDARVSKVVKALTSHFICTLYLSSADQLSSFKNLHVVLYEWGTESESNEVELDAVKCAVTSLFAEKSVMRNSVINTNDDDLLSARQKLLEDVEKVLMEGNKFKKADKFAVIQDRLMTDEYMRDYMRHCFQAYINAGDKVGENANIARAYVVNRGELEEWLVPPMLPIPYLMADIMK